MTAVVAIDAATITHTLPDKFAGLGGSNFRAANDFPVSGYRTALQNIAPEVLRWSPWTPVGTAASPGTGQAAMKALALFLGSDVAISMGPGSARPNAAPSTKATNDTTNLHANGEGSSPSDIADIWADWITAGIDVRWVEPFNEPANSAAPHTNGGGPWFGTTSSGSPLQSDINKCESWSYVQQRQFRAAVASKASAIAHALPRFAGGVIADTQPYAQGWAKTMMHNAFATNSNLDGTTWPWSDDNFPYFDTYIFHAYGSGNTDQGLINSITWNPGSFSTPNDSVAHKSMLANLRAFMDAHGGTANKLAWNEGGIDRFTAYAGLFDCVAAILAFSHQNIYKIDYFTSWSYNVSSTDSAGIWEMMDHTYTVNTRGRFNRDMVFYYSRNYKSQLISGTSAVTGSGNTPSSGENSSQNNSVPRINVAAGLNAAGNKICVLIANGDLTTAEDVTVNLANCTVTGAATGRKGLQTESGTGATTLPAITPITVTGNTFTHTIEAGAVYLIEIPVTVTGGGGGGGGGGGTGTPVLVQSTSNDDHTGTAVASISATFGSATTAGNLIPVVVSWVDAANSSETCTVTDSDGNTYTPVDLDYDTTDGVTIATFYAKNIAGGADTLTATFAGLRRYCTIIAHEVSGCDPVSPLDVHTIGARTAGASGTDGISSGSVTTTHANDYIFGFLSEPAGSAPTVAAGTGYTEREARPSIGSWSQDEVKAAAGAVASTWTLSGTLTSTQWIAGLMAFKPSTVAAPVNTVPPTIHGYPLVKLLVLVDDEGTWTGSSITYAFTWQRDNHGGGVWTTISTGTDETYLMTAADAGCKIRCQVTATNAGGSTTVASNSIGPVSVEQVGVVVI